MMDYGTHHPGKSIRRKLKCFCLYFCSFHTISFFFNFGYGKGFNSEYVGASEKFHVLCLPRMSFASSTRSPHPTSTATLIGSGGAQLIPLTSSFRFAITETDRL
ncbi:hypothetical protein HanPSC8_Chr08g0333351 [Helianthus annuus]|nr:hypothetical protein HanPSC8_Chr08g0333351 [Helianthus annuus]